MATPEELAALSQAYGPKRVKTPNQEVEQFSPGEIQKMLDAQNASTPVGLSDISMTIASPRASSYRNTSCHHYDEDDQ